MTRRTTSLMVAAACAGVVLSGCDGGATEPGGTTSSAPTSEVTTSTPSPSPEGHTATTTAPEPTLSAEEQDEADIVATLEDYTAALDAAKNGEASIEGIYPFSSGTAREQWITQVMAYDAQGLKLTGSVSLDVLEVTVDGDGAEVVACADVSQTDAVDEDGESVIAEDRLDETLIDYVLERGDWAEHGWAVTEHNNRDEPCDG